MQLDLIVGSTTYSLTDGNPYSLESATGLAMPPVRRFARSYPGQDGYDDLGHVLEPRTITLSLLFDAVSHTQLDERRSTLARMFAPGTNLPLVLEVTRDDGEKRRLDVTASGLSTIELDLAHRPGRLHKAQVTLRAAEPVWYSATPGTVTFGTVDATEWYLAAGRISAESVLEAITNPGENQLWNWPAPQESDSIMVAFRGLIPESGTVTLRAWTLSQPTESEKSNASLLRWRSFDTDYADQLRLHLSRPYIQFSLGDFVGSTVSVVAALQPNSVRVFVNEDLLINEVVSGGDYNADSATNRWRITGWPSIQYAATYRGQFTNAQCLALARSMGGTQDASVIGGTIGYLGDYHEYPVVTLSGPLTDPVIQNMVSGNRLDFTGSTIPAGVSYLVNLRNDALSVVDSGGTIRTSQLAEDSDLGSWALWSGANNVVVTSTTSGSASNVQIVYRNRYVSY